MLGDGNCSRSESVPNTDNNDVLTINKYRVPAPTGIATATRPKHLQQEANYEELVLLLCIGFVFLVFLVVDGPSSWTRHHNAPH